MLKQYLACLLFLLLVSSVLPSQTTDKPYRYDEWSELSKAAYNGDLNKVKELIKNGADVNKKDLLTPPALRAALQGKQYEVFK
jgi:ankyrin repeat protein